MNDNDEFSDAEVFPTAQKYKEQDEQQFQQLLTDLREKRARAFFYGY